MSLKVGDKMPTFKGLTTEGTITDKNIIGKSSIIYFYPKDSTPGCTKEACDFRDNISNFKKLGLEIYGVSKDSLTSHNKFADKYELPFTLISDEDTSICQAFGVWGKKKFMGREFTGVKRTTFLIDKKGIILKIWNDVKVKEHIEEVLEISQTLL